MDVIVIGGGHNGLVAAATLARKGHGVTLLEGRESFGGVAAGLLHDTDSFSPEIAKTLDLAGHGLEFADPAPVFVPSREGPGLLLHRDPVQAAGELGADAEAYISWRAFLKRVLPFAASQLDSVAPDISTSGPLLPLMRRGFAFRRMGKTDIHECLRIGPACVDDTLSEHFQSPLLRAALSARALQGTWMGPRSPSSTATLLLGEAQSGQEIVGGASSLVTALVAACESSGVELRPSSRVSRIQVSQGRATGVTIEGGESLLADRVLSCIGPRRTLLELIEPEHLPIREAGQMANLRLRGTLARVSLRLAEPIDYACRPGLRPTRSLVAEHPLDLERAFDHVKHRRMPTQLPLDIHQTDGEASILIRCATIELQGGWSDKRRQELGDLTLAALEPHVPNIRGIARVTRILTPTDIAQEFDLEGGHEMHGELSLDQLGPMRPSMTLARHATPIDALYLGSAGIHPGGAISGRPGWQAAQVVGSL